jgi:flavodoxin
MAALILVDSEFGNTYRVAEAIADGLAPLGASILRIGGEEPPWDLTPGLDLLLVGGPTMNRGLSPRLRHMLDVIAATTRDMPVAVFDTRLAGPEVFTGSASKQAAKRLRRAGAKLVAPPESFTVRRPSTKGRSRPEDVVLDDGELDRAGAWAVALLRAIDGERAA